MSKLSRLFSLMLVVALLMTTGVFAQVKNGQAAPDFNLQDHNGKSVKLSDLKGKIVVLEWFNQECPFVVAHYKDETRTMVKLADKYKDKDVVWLAVNSSKHHNVSINKETAEKWKLTFPILDDAKGTVGKTYGARTTPHMFIIDKQGMIAYQGAIDSGPKEKIPTNYVAKALDELTAGSTVSTPETKPYGCSVKY